nr:phosphoribosylformylglycinamidine synthase subunit PurQ [Haemophilus parainfluenzae]
MEFKTLENLTALQAQNLIVAQYIDSHLNVTGTCPASPNSSALGITVIYNVDGRITAIMPHLEGVFRAVSNSWYPED